MRLAILTIFISCALMFSYQAHAGWWDTVTEVINSDAGKQVTQSLENGNSGIASLTNTEISSGLKEALTIGTKQVVSQLGVNNGFNLDPKIHIPLPGILGRVDNALKAIGMGSLTERLETRLNHAAEIATPKAKDLFITAISKMTINDAKNILTGPNDAATQYLRKTMGVELSQEMQPIVSTSLASAGAVKAYDQVMGQYSQIPFMPDVKADLNDYVVEKAMDGIFYYVAQEEAAIRTNPIKRSTDLLKRVFSSQ